MHALDHALVVHAASVIGGVAFALSGYLVGWRKQLDLMGIFIVAFLTANGGGIIRDVLLGRQPAILLSTEPFWLTACVVLAASLLKLQHWTNLERRWLFVVSDGIGLVAFGITGAVIALEAQLHFFGILMLSLLTATGGGIIRDILVNELPEVLHTGFYGSVALLIALALYTLNHVGLLSPAFTLVVFALGLLVRLVAYHRQWQLPKLPGNH